MSEPNRGSPRLAVVCLGHPLEPRTWSGTPANLCAELRRREALAVAIDSEAYAPRALVVAAKIASKAFYFGSRYVRLGRVERWLRARHVQRRLRRQSRPGEPPADVLHVNVHALPTAAAPEPPGEGGPLERRFLLTDTTWHLWREHATDAGRILPRLVRDAERLEQAAYRQLDHIFVIGAYVRDNLVSHYGVPAGRVSVVGTGRGAIQSFNGPKNYANGRILFVAKERFRDKGGEALLAGFRLARETRPGLQLTLVGREEYARLAAGIPGVTARGRVSLTELQSLFEEASLFALPARNEPWGLVYLEALSCRTPVLGLRRNALPEITGDGRFGFCLDNDRPETVAAALLEAFADPARLARMGAEGQRFCLENFTWERMADRMLETINRLPRPAPAPPLSPPAPALP